MRLSLTRNVMLVSGVRHGDSTSLHGRLRSLQVWLASVTMKQHSTADRIPCTVPFAPVTDPFPNRKPVPPTPLPPFCADPSPPPHPNPAAIGLFSGCLGDPATVIAERGLWSQIGSTTHQPCGLASLSLSFLSSKRGAIAAPMSWVGCED